MKAILIDPKTKTVSEVELEKKGKSTLDSLYSIIECDLVENVVFDGVHDVWVDEEGLLKLDENSMFFTIDSYPQPLVGRAIITKVDDYGESQSPDLSVDDVRQMVKFHTLEEVQML